MKLSIIIPVRKDCTWLNYFLDSFIENTFNRDEVELLLGIAHDDTTTIVEGKNIHVIRLDQRKRKFGVADYSNELAKLAKGQLIWWLSDECIIKTKNYDVILCEYADKYSNKIYKFASDGNNGGGWAYPILTKKWIEKVGFFADHVSIDSWLNTVSEQLPKDRSIVIDKLHIEDRRITGKIFDSEYIYLPPEVEFHIKEWAAEVILECKEMGEKLFEFIKKENL